MTECKRSNANLKRLSRQPVEVDFNGGTLTSDGGLLMLREVDDRLDLIRRAAEIIPDPRDPKYVVRPQTGLLTSRIFGIAAGYEDANDHEHLRHDAAFQVAAGHTPAQGQYARDAAEQQVQRVPRQSLGTSKPQPPVFGLRSPA